MAGSPIRRLVQLILDRIAAKRMQDDAKQAIDGVETRLAGLGRVARAVGGFLASVFGVRALIRFGTSAVQEFIRAERAAADLKGTIEATGESFEDFEPTVRALGEAFEELTVHSDEDLNESLTRLITLTGDVGASINNMGLVANVAAQFFRGDLVAATDLVGKVMQGQVMPLTRLGIAVESAQEGLDVLAKRSFGAAERAANTLHGKLLRLNNGWHEFKEELGGVLVGSGNTVGALDTLIATVKSMQKWVIDNKEELKRWVKEGIDVAIGSIKTLVGWMQTYFQLRGKLSMTVGNAPAPLADNAKALEAQIKGFERQRKIAAAEQARLLAAMEAIENSDAPQKLKELDQTRLEELNRSLMEANSTLEQIDDNAARAKEKLAGLGKAPPDTDLFGKKPQVGKNAKGDDDPEKLKKLKEKIDPATAAINEFLDRMREIDILSRLLGDDFDALGEEASALQTVIEALAAEGWDEGSPKMRAYRDRLKEIGLGLAEVSDNAMFAGATLADTLDEIALKAKVIGPEFDATAATIDAYTQELLRMGAIMDQNDPSFVAMLGRLRQLQEGAKKAAAAENMRAIAAENVAAAMGAAAFGELGDIAEAKAKQNTLQALEYGLLALGDALLGGGLKVGPLLALAAEHTALAALWGGLAAVGGGGGAGGGLSGAQGASGDSSRKVDTGSVVYVGFIGPGFRATNPEVQDVWRGTEKIVREKFPNAKRITVVGKGP